VVAFGCTFSQFLDGKSWALDRIFNEIGMIERSSEKAGVGGSIPSLATCFQQLTAIA